MPRFRRARRRTELSASPLSQEQRIERGEGGERVLQDWLDRSKLAYLFLDQTPLTMPASCRRDIKRPDFLVAIEGLGIIALDAKAKTITDGCFVLDASERRRLDAFETAFAIPIWYVCFPPHHPGRAYLFRNRDLMGSAVSHDPTKQIIHAPLTLGSELQHAVMPFARGLLGAGASMEAPAGKSP